MRILSEAIFPQETPGEDAERTSSAQDLDGAFSAVASIDNASRLTRIETVDGSAVWREWGNGPPLVMLHGGAGSWSHFVRQIAPFSENYRVIAPDLPGFGDSDACKPDSCPQRMARVLAAGIDELTGQEPLYLVGFSYGGIIGGYLAHMFAPRIRGFVIVGGVGFEARRQQVTLSSWRHLSDPAARRAVHRKNLQAIMIADPARIDATAILIQQKNAERARHDTRPTAGARPLTRILDESSVPLAAIWGEHDQLAAPYFEERRDWLAARDPGAPFKLVANAGHWVQYEAAGAFNAALDDCLRSFAGRSG